MPLIHITLLKGRSDTHLAELSRAVHNSLVEAYGMDERDRFQVFHEVDAGRLIFSPDYAGGPRSDAFTIIHVISMSRTQEAKEALYRVLVRRLAESPGLRKEDIFVCSSDQLTLDDISFANGISARELSKRLGRDA